MLGWGCVPQPGTSKEEDATVIVLPDAAVEIDGGGGDDSAVGADVGAAADAGPAQCADGEDNDGDGDIDLADDGCASAQDDDESDDPVAPQCSDGEDNDADGFTDFPADPGCGSEHDEDESDDVAVRPQCGDGIDNDNDGRVDLADPGCVSPADPREADPGPTPACSNALDDDDDGVVDFPFDIGCAAAGDDTEDDPGIPPQCGDGADNDADGQADFPFDPGCAGVGDADETDPPVPPACSDGRDNDRDEQIDYPDDRGCESAADGSESGSCGAAYDPLDLAAGQIARGDSRRGQFESRGSCGGQGAAEVVFTYRVDVPVEALVVTTAHEDTEVETVLYVRRACLDGATEVGCSREPLDEVAANELRIEAPALGDYYIFLDGATGRGGQYALRVEEVPLAQCLNGIDDDDDGRIDYPQDPGCVEPEDREEIDPPVLPACADDEDNDGDGLIDYPLDAGCQAAADNDEVDVCGQGIAAHDFPVGEPFALGSTAAENATNSFTGSCGGQAQKEVVFRYANPHNAHLDISVRNEDSVNNLVLYARSACADPASELACDNGEGQAERQGEIRLERMPPGDIFIFVDTAFGLGGDFKLTVESERLPPGCADGVDNDEDGFLDADDVGCADAEDEDERDPAEGEPAPECWNELDDDGDGETDYPFDPGCAAKGDVDETDPLLLPECANREDDDEDELIDWPEDFGCDGRGDDDEERERPGQCGNRLDDDEDGAVDFPTDPGCFSVGDLSEADDDRSPECSDERDNDRDGLVDFPFDSGCLAAGAPVEGDPAVAPICFNQIDDDEDGEVDFPRDRGCTHAADESEEDPPFPAQCANGADDDGDGAADWPNDPNCLSRADASEGGRRRVFACSNGNDDDGDGVIDLADRGCEDARDDDEADPAEPTACFDGVDNDGDGDVDWPDDDGCAAQGDVCEQDGFGICDGVCLDLSQDPANCGRCGRVCDDGVECIDGFCGGLFAFEGIRENVPDEDIGGWEQCHRSLYGDTNDFGPILAACDGEFVMYGCRQTGNPNWQLLAMGERAEVFRDTGRQNNNLNVHNGVAWYFSTSYSLGFVLPGTAVRRNSCDTDNAQPQFRLCWHSNGNRMTGGYRCGARTGLNGARDWERAIWTSR